MAKKIIQYDRNAAVKYAQKWAFGRNPDYYDFESLGGDCTNFASQCIYAGVKQMNYTPDIGWYYINANNKSPAWSGVEFLRNFLINNADNKLADNTGPFAEESDVKSIMPGDIIQLSFDGVNFSHSPVVVQTGKEPALDNILIATHSYDSNYRPITSYNYKKIRFLHILGVRK